MDTGERRNNKALNRKELKRLPINLRKKAIREARNNAGMQKQIPKRQRRPRAQQNDFERAEHNAMLAATSQKLQEILANCKELDDIPYDCTPAELWGKVRTRLLFSPQVLCGENNDLGNSLPHLSGYGLRPSQELIVIPSIVHGPQ